MIRKLFVGWFIAVLFLALALSTSAQPDGTTDCPTLSPRLNNDLQLSLIDPQTNQVVHTETLPYAYTFRYSPDCRFLFGNAIGYRDCGPGLIIWNAVSGERMQSFNGMCDTGGTTFPRVIWKPDNSVAIISEWYRGRLAANFSTTDRYLWYPDRNQLILLESEGSSYEVQPSLLQVEWDDERGWLWSSGIGGIAAFDVESGARTIDFRNPPDLEYYFQGAVSSFTFSPDRSFVALHGQSLMFGNTQPTFTVYDIAAGTGIQVNPELNGAGTVALSPDNRYLTMSYTAIRVWDLHALPENLADRLPIYRLPLPNAQIGQSRVYFADNNTLVAETPDGETRFVYDMTTGQRVE
ncbi:MAG: hypothetical protein KME04_19710 [Pleurocapsa minor GSE-CHR-MK-17-07R]|jgi:hypothetical protein|nr:hypothetical protein [Pleurocapsa minor GSE-CHR-MK 17-07R]